MSVSVTATLGMTKTQPCEDPEIFVRGGPTLTTFFFQLMSGGESKYHYKQAIIGVSLAC